MAKPLVRQVESDEGVLALDDSIEAKPYTDKNELLCWHGDHAKGRNVKGINFLTAFYVTAQGGLPVTFDLVTKTETFIDLKTCQQQRRSSLTKNECGRMLLHVCLHNQLRFRYVLADSWYASADNFKDIKQTLKKEFVTPLKSNRKVA